MNNKIKRIKDGNKNGYCEETSEDGSITKANYIDGKPDHKIESEDLVDHLENLIREKISKDSSDEASIIAKEV